MTKLAILDKDGTLIRSRSGHTFVRHPEDQELLPGVEDAIARLVADGYKLAIASNQGGVAAGYKTLEQAIAEMNYCIELLSNKESFWRAYFCPDNGETCWEVFDSGKHRLCPVDTWKGQFRKPNPGMLRQALNSVMVYSVVTDVLYIGDRHEDEQAAQAAGIPFVWAHDWRGDRHE